ncbi:MAG: proton-conducting transporter membrane subunit, partial [Candidatus Eisenbacteria bacterium]
ATIGVTQFDIKKVLAYSTVSQLGYMFLGVGVGAFSAGLFHVVTHAFFKALLFLGSGSVIHALSGEQDIRKMGGLLNKIPITGRTFLVGWLAICGIFPFAGFFSKDEILWRTFSWQHAAAPWLGKALWLVAFLAAGVTALYMTRLVAMTFWGKSRVSHDVEHHIHESPPTMTIPLIVLAAGSILIGFLGTPDVMHLGGNRFERWLEPVFAAGETAAHGGAGHAMLLGGEHAVGSEGANSGALLEHASDPHATTGHPMAEGGHAAAEHAAHNPGLEWGLMLASLSLAAIMIGVGRRLWVATPEVPVRMAQSFGGLYRLVLDKWRVDELYNAVVVRPLVGTSRKFLWGTVDVKVIDFLVNLVGIFAKIGSYGLRFFQTGYVQAYAFVLLLGLTLIVFLGLRPF